MQKYSIWIEHSTARCGNKSVPMIVIYKEDEVNHNSKPCMQFEVSEPNGTIALSNGSLIEYHLDTESFGIMITRNNNTHIYRDGTAYAIFTEDELEWVFITGDNTSYVWVKRD